MKLLTRDADNNYLLELKKLLEENGIPSIVHGDNTARIIPSVLMSQAGLWVYLDAQFNDAVKLINNPEYEVTTKVDVDEFYSSQSNEEDQPNLLNKALIELALYALALCAGYLAIIYMLAYIRA